MSSTANCQLKLYVEQPPKPARPPVEVLKSLPEILQAFEATTGWPLRLVSDQTLKSTSESAVFIPLEAATGFTPGCLQLETQGTHLSEANPPPVSFASARRLAESFVGLLNELQQTRHALWQREAELASHITPSPTRRDENHLAERLQAALQGGAEAIGCQAAALYLLDEATTELKLRSSWGLPFERLAAPGRQLKGCLPDLEALLGHAVVLENTALMPGWTAPEDFPAAVCVPVSSPTTLLGTLWVFCLEPRDFTDQQVNVLEIVAGKIAGDLERESLLHESHIDVKLKSQWVAAQRLQRHQLPPVAPLFDGWEIAGRTSLSQGIGGAFYDWFCLPDGLLAFTAGESLSQGLEAALAAGTVRTAVRAHGQYHRQAGSALQQVNLSLWTGFAGDQFTALCYGFIETATGNIRWASAGQPLVILLRNKQWKTLTQTAPLLGESPETEYVEHFHTLQPGETLVILTPGFQNAASLQGHPLNEENLAPLLTQNACSAAELTLIACESLQPYSTRSRPLDSALLVIKRTES